MTTQEAALAYLTINPNMELVKCLMIEGVIDPRLEEFWKKRCKTNSKIEFIKWMRDRFHPKYLCDIHDIVFEHEDVVQTSSPGSLCLLKSKMIGDRYFPEL